MLNLCYTCIPAGAPDDYGQVCDLLADGSGALMQQFPKGWSPFPNLNDGLLVALEEWVQTRSRPNRPVILMVHGYLFDPTLDSTAGDNPFHSVFACPPEVHEQLSWLPLIGGCDAVTGPPENAIAFAYTTRSSPYEFSMAGWSNSYQYAVFDQAPLAARALASVLFHLGQIGVPVRILAHSLGTRTVSQAIGIMGVYAPRCVQRIVFLDGAEFSVDAIANLSPHPIEVVNVLSRADLVLELGASSFCHPIRVKGTLEACVVGYDGLGPLSEHWVDLQLDRHQVREWALSGAAPTGRQYRLTHQVRGFDPHPHATMGHWCCYTDLGNRELVRDLLLEDSMTVPNLVLSGAPDGSTAPAYGHYGATTGPPPTPQTRLARWAALQGGVVVADGSG